MGLTLATAQAQTGMRTIKCPLRVATEAARLNDSAQFPGFQARFYEGSFAYLVSVGLSNGPVAVNSDVAPSQLQPYPQWNLDSFKAMPHAVCRYEGGILLSRPLGMGLKSCVADTRRADPQSTAGIGYEFAMLSCV
jgi:hypothetical protein